MDAWQKLQQQKPLVQCITNKVASNYVANVLLACGASPAMIDNPFEAEDFTKITHALSINLGTPTTEQIQAMHISAKTAQNYQIPWVLDPVGYGNTLKWRSDTTDTLLQFKPTVIRGNASEIHALAGQQAHTKGVDSTLHSADTYQHAQSLLAVSECIAISGKSDFILSQEGIFQINGGSDLQPKVTATGCALGALISAYCAVTSPLIATISAHVHFAIAGKLAEQKTTLIGSFNTAFIDELYALTPEKIAMHIEVNQI